MKTFQVGCPKCHGQLNSISPLNGQVMCPFCGTVYQITANLNKEAEMPGQIVPFATSSDDFKQSSRKMLLDEDYAPANISEIVSFKDVKGIYLPVYLYEGQYECAWSCRIKQTTDTDAAKNRKETYRSQNGVSKDEYAIVCEGVETDKELAEYIRSLNYRDDDIKPFHPDDLHDCFFLIRNRDVQKTWTQRGEAALDNLVRKKTMMKLQSNDIKDFKYDITSELYHEGKFMFYPLWMVNYRYDGEQHHIFMDGTGRNGIKGTTLIDRALKAEAEKPFTILKYIAVVAIVIPLFMLLASWYKIAIIALIVTGLVFFGYRYYARWHRKKVIRKARKKFNV